MTREEIRAYETELANKMERALAAEYRDEREKRDALNAEITETVQALNSAGYYVSWGERVYIYTI